MKAEFNRNIIKIIEENSKKLNLKVDNDKIKNIISDINIVAPKLALSIQMARIEKEFNKNIKEEIKKEVKNNINSNIKDIDKVIKINLIKLALESAKEESKTSEQLSKTDKSRYNIIKLILYVSIIIGLIILFFNYKK